MTYCLYVEPQIILPTYTGKKISQYKLSCLLVFLYILYLSVSPNNYVQQVAFFLTIFLKQHSAFLAHISDSAGDRLKKRTWIKVTEEFRQFISVAKFDSRLQRRRAHTIAQHSAASIINSAHLLLRLFSISAQAIFFSLQSVIPFLVS